MSSHGARPDVFEANQRPPPRKHTRSVRERRDQAITLSGRREITHNFRHINRQPSTRQKQSLGKNRAEERLLLLMLRHQHGCVPISAYRANHGPRNVHASTEGGDVCCVTVPSTELGLSGWEGGQMHGTEFRFMELCAKSDEIMHEILSTGRCSSVSLMIDGTKFFVTRAAPKVRTDLARKCAVIPLSSLMRFRRKEFQIGLVFGTRAAVK